MSKYIYIIFIPVILLGIQIANSQEIFREKRGVYSTDKIISSISKFSGNHITIETVPTISGSIAVSTSKKHEIVVTYYKKSKASSRSRAIDNIDLISVDMNVVAGGVRLQIRAPNPAPWSGTNESGWVEAELTVPEDAFLDVNAPIFDFEAEGPFSGVIVESSLGRLDVTGVTGKLDLFTANQRVSIADISGEISVITSNSSLEAFDVESKNKRAIFRNENGDITIDGFTGEISAKTDYGRIELSNYHPRGKRNIIRGNSSPVDIEITEITDAQVVIANRFEDIDLSVPANLSATLSLVVGEEGKIEVSNLQFQTDLIEQNRLSLIAGKGDAAIRSTVRGGGNIYVRGIDKR